MKNIAIITARGGSKRIPRKNIREFCGRPILCYSIDAALGSGVFDEVMVSTDDEEIAGIARGAGAQVPFLRSAENAGDYATTNDVLREVVLQYEQAGQFFDRMCCIYPTAPFVTADKLKRAMALLQEKDADMICPVVQYSFPPQRSFILDQGKLSYRWPEYQTARSQDLEPYYHDCGQFYIYRMESFHNKPAEEWIRIPFILSELEMQDIDNETDWKLAEIKYQLMCEQKK